MSLPPVMSSFRFSFLMLFLSLLPFAAPDLISEQAALLAFQSAVGPLVIPWNASTSPCSWQGVACESGTVTVLRLPAVGLIGPIPNGIFSNLTGLRTISLRFNALSGPLPADLVSLSELRNLYLQNNRFSGEIPVGISRLENLVRLDIADNDISGEIPDGLNNLTRLGTLLLENNKFIGEIPNLDLPNLVQFNISFNRFNGSVPPKLRTKPAEAFLGMSLCGGPLPACPGGSALAPGPSVEEASGVTRKRKSRKLSGGKIAAIAIGCVVFALLLVLLLIFCRKRTKSRTRSMEAGVDKPPESEIPMREKRMPGNVVNGNGAAGRTVDASSAVAAFTGNGQVAPGGGGSKKLVFFKGGGANVFDLEDLLRASAEVLGKGTFGTAYKAVLETGTIVAVKRLKDVNLPEEEFKEKIEPAGAMAHPNLVPLRAYYYSRDEKLLVYDFMPMGSLSALLHGNRGSGRTPLNWEARVTIALSAARGIEYIHSTGPGVSHGNIKSSNILLAKSYDAHVSDHGLAHLVNPSSTLTRVAGYRAPEVTDARRVSQKADVYSFGVLLLELLTGKAPAQALLNDEGVDLPRWVQSVVREEWTSEVFDLELLRYHNVEEEMVELLQLAIDCAAQYPDKRPTISEVVSRIEDIHRLNSETADADQPHLVSDPAPPA